MRLRLTLSRCSWCLAYAAPANDQFSLCWTMSAQCSWYCIQGGRNSRPWKWKKIRALVIGVLIWSAKGTKSADLRMADSVEQGVWWKVIHQSWSPLGLDRRIWMIWLTKNMVDYIFSWWAFALRFAQSRSLSWCEMRTQCFPTVVSLCPKNWRTNWGRIPPVGMNLPKKLMPSFFVLWHTSQIYGSLSISISHSLARKPESPASALTWTCRHASTGSTALVLFTS